MLTMPDALWDRTKSISEVIAPLAARAIAGRAAVDAAASTLRVSPRQVYVLIKRHRDWVWFADGFGPGALLWWERNLATVRSGRGPYPQDGAQAVPDQKQKRTLPAVRFRRAPAGGWRHEEL